MIDIIEYEERKTQINGLTNRVNEQLQTALDKKGSARLVVPGGSTPVPFFQEISKRDLDWKNICVFLTDERFVPVDSPRSNMGLIQKHFMINKASECQFFPYYYENYTPEALADRLSKDMRHIRDFDVCVLGMGVDMHTASLFPSMDRLNEALLDTKNRKIIAVYPDSQDEARLTLTAPVLRSSTHLHLLINGIEKRTALKRALRISNTALAPIKALMRADKPINIHYCP